MLIWISSPNERVSNYLQLYNIKGIGKIVEYNKEFIDAPISKDMQYTLLQKVVELDENTLFPVYLSEVDLIKKYPQFTVVLESLRVIHSGSYIPNIEAIILLDKLDGTLPTTKRRILSGHLVNKVGMHDNRTAILLRAVERLVSMGIADEGVMKIIDYLRKEGKSTRLFSPKSEEIVTKVLEIVNLLERNRNYDWNS